MHSHKDRKNKYSEPVGAYQGGPVNLRVNNTHPPAVDISISHLLKLSPNLTQTQPRTKHTVSSLHIEWIWVPNITAVKVKNRRPSRHRKINRITVIGGEKSLHSANERKDAMSLAPRTLTVAALGQLPGRMCSSSK